MSNVYISLQAVYMFKTLRIRQLTTISPWKKLMIQDNGTFEKCGKIEVINCCLKFFLLPLSALNELLFPDEMVAQATNFEVSSSNKQR